MFGSALFVLVENESVEGPHVPQVVNRIVLVLEQADVDKVAKYEVIRSSLDIEKIKERKDRLQMAAHLMEQLPEANRDTFKP